MVNTKGACLDEHLSNAGYDSFSVLKKEIGLGANVCQYEEVQVSSTGRSVLFQNGGKLRQIKVTIPEYPVSL